MDGMSPRNDIFQCITCIEFLLNAVRQIPLPEFCFLWWGQFNSNSLLEKGDYWLLITLGPI